MTTTTSLKLPEELKAQIAEAAKQEGKTAHALMVETLQTAMNETRLRNQFYQEALEAYEETKASNICYSHEEMTKWMRARIRGDKTVQPTPQAYDPSKPMRPELLKNRR
ncbi:MAG: hypothetical protein HC858_01645 [Brachymonas sp.]|nr:hypothetical protein [Brachymonas sp.]NJS36890.1 hypothetical protein [Brachymonas sp.]